MLSGSLRKACRLIAPVAVLSLLFPSFAMGQKTIDRQSVISEARRLKNIYKTEVAIDLLSKLVNVDSLGTEVLNELADCHIQAGDLESAASTYDMLSMIDPVNLLYKVKKMHIAYRMKNYPSCVKLGRSILMQDTIPAMISPDPATLGRIYRAYGLGYMHADDFKSAIEYYSESYKVDNGYYAALSSIAYCYERLKDWKHDKEYYELYLTRAKKGSKGYDFAMESLDYVKQQLFMEE